MGTTAEKLNYLKETKSEIKNALETPSNIFRDYPSLIKKYIDNQPTKVVSDGVCSNAVDLPTKAINVDGNSEQKTYSGKNLAYTDWAEEFVNRISDIQKAKIETKDGRNCLYYRGDAGGGNYNAKYLFKTNWKENTQYTISFDIYPSEKYANILLEYTDGTTSYPAKWGWLTVQQWQHLSATSDSNKTIKYIRCEYASGFDYIDLDTFMIKESSVGDDTYEPYVGGMPSPNPSYPQKIKVVDGCNLFYIDKKDITENKWLSYDEQEKTFTIKQGTGVAPEAIPINVNLEAGTTITVSFIMLTGKYTTGLISLGTYHINPNSWQGKIDLPQSEDLAGKTFNSTVTITDTINGFMPFIYGTPTVEEDIVFKIQLTEGTIQKPYLPYGSIGLEQSGKNKLDFKKILENANAVYTERDGVFNLTNQGKLYSAPYKLNLKPNTTYTIYQNFQEQNSTNVRLSIVRGSNYERVVESYSTSEAESYRKKTFTTDESSDYYIRGDWSLLYSPLIYNEPILVEGTDVIPYEPYHEPIITPINLQGNTLGKVGDVKDLLKIYRNGDVEISKNIREVVFTGNENWQSDLSGNKIEDGVYGAALKISDMKDYPRFAYGNLGKTSIACNYFKLSDIYGKAINGIDNGWGSNIYITISTSEIDNPTTISEGLTKFKQWLSTLYNTGTPVYVDYQLAEPETIKLPSIDPIELWQGTNIFKLITNLDTTFEVEYIVNKDSVLNEVQTAMLEAEIEI